MLDRESLSMQQWLEEKAPTASERLRFALEDADAVLEDINNFNTIKAGSITSSQLDAGVVSWSEETGYKRAGDHNPHFNHVHITEGEMDAIALGKQGIPAMHVRLKQNEDRDLYRQAIRDYSTRPVVSPPRRELEVLKVVDVDEVFWDLTSMIDAHRNGCTALDDQRSDVPIDTASPPLFQEIATYMWDPRHEMGPRERDWVRHQRKCQKK